MIATGLRARQNPAYGRPFSCSDPFCPGCPVRTKSPKTFLAALLLFLGTGLAAAQEAAGPGEYAHPSPELDTLLLAQLKFPLCQVHPERCLVPWPEAPAGWRRALLPAGTRWRVDSIAVVSRDAFDDTEYKAAPDSAILKLGNHFHWETRESVVRRCLPFAEGDTLDAETALEAERILRRQKFLNEAIIELWENAEGRHLARVVACDRFSLSVPLALSFPDDEVFFTVGVIEHNLFGTGNSLGGLFSHNDERDTWKTMFHMPHFLLYDQRLEADWSWSTDGYEGALQLYRPFTTLDTRWAWTLAGMLRKYDSRWAWRRQSRKIELTEHASDTLAYLVNPDKAVTVADLNGIYEDSLSVRVSHASGGRHFKSYLRLGWDRLSLERPKSVDTLNLAIAAVDASGNPDTLVGRADSELPRAGFYGRHDSRFGVRHTFKSMRYVAVRNLKNVRWIEDVEVGWSLWTGISRNFEALGADRDEWRLEHGFDAMKVWNGRCFFRANAATHYYADKGFSDGWLSGAFDLTRKSPNGRSSTSVGATFQSYYADEGNRQIRLGGTTGFYGFPSDWMVGRTAGTAYLEERWHPDFEFGTVVPVFALFGRAGGAWDAMDKVDVSEMEAAVGVGLRLGMSKSVNGVVNHLDVSWPVNGTLADGFAGARISLLAHTSL